MTYEKGHKTLVFNELYNWLIINELGFRGKKPRFAGIFRFIIFYILITYETTYIW